MRIPLGFEGSELLEKCHLCHVTFFCGFFTVDNVCYLLRLERFMRDFWAFTTKLILLSDVTRETLVISAVEGDLWGCFGCIIIIILEVFS
jgi:hypothetical protein